MVVPSASGQAVREAEGYGFPDPGSVTVGPSGTAAFDEVEDIALAVLDESTSDALDVMRPRVLEVAVLDEGTFNMLDVIEPALLNAAVLDVMDARLLDGGNAIEADELALIGESDR